jgi:phosphohistidine phosphatase
MNLYILRHGLAVEHGTPGYASDADRPLTPEGERETRQIASATRSMKLSLDLILTSPFVRARRTAQIVADEHEAQASLRVSDELKPGGPFEKLVERINGVHPAPRNVMLVGHEPDLSELIALLLAGEPHALSVRVTKGGLCKLSIEILRCSRCAILKWLLTPNQMALMQAPGGPR